MSARVLVLVASLAFAPPLRAQAPEDGDRSVILLTAAGLLGGVVGTFGGGYLGALVADGECDECFDFLGGAIAGAAIGESLLLPFGVHLANGRRGSYWTAAAISAGLAAGGIAAMAASGWDPPVVPIVLVAVPITQLGLSVAIERR